MAVFTTFDIVFFIVTLMFALVATYRGIVKELFSFINWVTALALSYLISPFISSLLEGFFSNKLILDVVVRMLVFLSSFIVFIIFTSNFSRDLSLSLHPALNRILGLGFGIIKSIIIFGLFFAFYNYFFDYALGSRLADKEQNKMPKWYQDSITSPLTTFSGKIFEPIAKNMIDFLKGNLSKTVEGYKIDEESNDNLVPNSPSNPDNGLGEIIDKVNSQNLDFQKTKPALQKEGDGDKNIKTPPDEFGDSSRGSGYNKKDIEKMQRLIEIINN